MMDSVAQYYGFKNRLINPAMSIWQRGTSITLTASTFTYTTDRWVGYTANTGTVVSRSTDVPSGNQFQYSARIQRPASNTGVNGHVFEQIIESVNMYDLAGQSVTFSFWAKAGANFSASGNTLNFAVNTGTVADQGNATSIGAWTGFAQPLNTSVALTTTWTKYTVTGTIGSTALEMAAYFNWTPTGTAGADDSIYITGVQLEEGVTATSFDVRPYGTELILCQRYYQGNLANGNTSSIVGNVIVRGQSTTTGAYFYWMQFPVLMRAAPTMNIGNPTYSNANSATFFNVTPGGAEISFTVTSAGGYAFLPWRAEIEL